MRTKTRLIAISSVSVLIIGLLSTFLIITNNKVNTSEDFGFTNLKNFYNAKDVVACMVDFTLGKVEFDVCQPYFDRMVAMTKMYNELGLDMSRYY